MCLGVGLFSSTGGTFSGRFNQATRDFQFWEVLLNELSGNFLPSLPFISQTWKLQHEFSHSLFLALTFSIFLFDLPLFLSIAFLLA